MITGHDLLRSGSGIGGDAYPIRAAPRAWLDNIALAALFNGIGLLYDLGHRHSRLRQGFCAEQLVRRQGRCRRAGAQVDRTPLQDLQEMGLHPVRGNEETSVCISFQVGLKVTFFSDENRSAFSQLWPAGWIDDIMPAPGKAFHQRGQHSPALQLHRAAQTESGGVFCNKDLHGRS